MQTYLSEAGLYLPNYSMDERAVQRALTEINDRFILWPPDAVSPFYRVVYRVSDWQEALIVATCMDDYGNPLPLSSAFVEQVKGRRLDAPNRGPSVDEHNERLQERIDRDAEARSRAVVEEHRAKVERAQTRVSFGPLAKLGEFPNRRKR